MGLQRGLREERKEERDVNILIHYIYIYMAWSWGRCVGKWEAENMLTYIVYTWEIVKE